MSKYKIGIGLTAGPQCMVNWVGLISAFQAMSGRDWSDYQFEIFAGNSIYISLNRNLVVLNFLKSDCDYLLFLDHDNGFFPEAFDQLMEVMEDSEVKIVSGAYYLKKPNCTTLVAGQKAPHTPIFKCEFYPQEAFVQEGLKNISKDYSSDGGLVGAGFLLVRKEVYEALEYPYFHDTYLTKEVKGTPGISYFLGEDNYFCMKVQEAGFDIYLDTRIKSPHMAGGQCFPAKWKQYKELKL
jgi:GT2 family glycosyltransferase